MTMHLSELWKANRRAQTVSLSLLQVADAGYTKVVLRPLMVVAGDHANNDMAGEDAESWLSMFNASGNFESVDAQVEGLGRIEAIQQIYVDHSAAAIGE